jgi:hypothetical protein
MKWIVIEELQLITDYIPVLAANQNKRLQIENKKCSVFFSLEKAMARARELRELYSVRNIRLFQQEG